MSENNSTHWADIYAAKIIREKGDKELYTCASGITLCRAGCKGPEGNGKEGALHLQLG